MVFPRSSTPLLLKRSAQRPTAVSMRTEVPARFPKSLIKAMTGLATFMLLLLLKKLLTELREPSCFCWLWLPCQLLFFFFLFIFLLVCP